MSDDHAAHAISAYGSRINRTPHLDRLATGGLRFANCFVVNSICTPSRAAILTGKYSHKNGVPVFNRFDGSQPHVAKYLQQAGYQTAIIGKWHLFSDPTGFDYWNVLPGQGKYHDPVLIEMGRTNVVKGYVTDIITDLAIEWLKKRDPARPFFLCAHHKAPHREWSPAARHATLYEEADIPTPVTFDDDYRGRSRAAAEATMRIERNFVKTDLKQDPPPGLSGAALKRWNYQRYIKDYLRCVAAIDENVGRLLDFLDASGLRTNTLVIYTSDQGFFLGEHGWYDKRFMYEESLRMPLLVSWPGHVPAGRVNSNMVLNVDFAPTFLELAGLAAPADVQGRSLAPLLRGAAPSDWRTTMYYRYYHYPRDHRVQPHYGVRTERHKLIYFNQLDEWELYDLERDPYETNNIYAAPASAGLVAELKRELARLRRELDDRDQFADLLDSGQRFGAVPPELVLRYDFAQRDGDLIKDAGGKGFAARVVGVTSVAGRKGAALRFDGQGALSLAAGAPGPDPALKPFSVGAWCQPTRPDGVVIALGGPAQGFSLYLREGVPHFALRSGGELVTARASAKIPTGQWTHLMAMLRASGEIALFVEGQPAGAAKSSPIQRKPADGLSIGTDSGGAVTDYGGAPGWHGLLEDVRLYWGELGGEELQRWAGR
jgi:arylsulfatase A-like enzyme